MIGLREWGSARSTPASPAGTEGLRMAKLTAQGLKGDRQAMWEAIPQLPGPQDRSFCITTLLGAYCC